MNKRIVFRNEKNEVFHCILSGEKDFDEQLNYFQNTIQKGTEFCPFFIFISF